MQSLHPGDKIQKKYAGNGSRYTDALKSPKIGRPWLIWIILGKAVTVIVERSFEYRSNDICHHRLVMDRV